MLFPTRSLFLKTAHLVQRCCNLSERAVLAATRMDGKSDLCSLSIFFLYFISGIEKEATIVNSTKSSMLNGHFASYLLNGKGLDGVWQGDHCALISHGENGWFSFELDAPEKLSRVQIAPRVGTPHRARNVHITIGPSVSYDPNEPYCLPMIPQLVMKAGFTDYNCTEPLHEGKYVKISRGVDGTDGVMDLCEIKIFTKGSNRFRF